MKLAESFGAKGYEIGSADELAPTLRKALDDDAVSIIACPVDYAENARLIERLGAPRPTRSERRHLQRPPGVNRRGR